jgi:hypothetical protein
MSLRETIGVIQGYKRMRFTDLVSQTTGWRVTEIDPKHDSFLIREIARAMNQFMSESNTFIQRYRGNRVNDIGMRLKDEIWNRLARSFYRIEAHEVNDYSIDIHRLRQPGYPDFRIWCNDPTEGKYGAYLTLKLTSQLEGGSDNSQRYLYYTTGSKINMSARHLVLDLLVSEESPKYWQVCKWVLKDLYEVRMNVKLEFSATKQDLIDLPELASGQ